MIPRLIVLSIIICTSITPSRAQDMDLSSLQTRAEITEYRETTRYEEVISFLDAAVLASPRLHLTSFGYTTEGRMLPLLVFGEVWDATPEEVRRHLGKTRVFIQANIHAGEVCGKEAMLMLARSLAAGEHAAWADSLILMIAPIYNADGNERVSLYNRPGQHGPVGGMGQRPNAQGYDLNRDHMKLDSPEARSLVRMMREYDPHVLVDLHTTNGTVHGYHLTYSPPLNPNTPPPIISMLRNEWLPAVTKRIKAMYDWDYYYYGNVPRNGERGWYTFDHRPRFNNNYVGLRNRFAILSEAYAYATFEDRVFATLYFVEEILNYAHQYATRIRRATEHTDMISVVGQQMAVRSRPQRSEEPVDILLGEAVEDKNPYTGEAMLLRRNVQKQEKMYEYGTFEAEETETAPRAYIVPATLKKAVDLLDAHGIHYDTLAEAHTLRLERFRIDSTTVAERPFQGRHERTLFGGYDPVEATLPAGTLIVPVDQALGRLAFYLLEPRSDDGLIAWALIDDALKNTSYYPILREPAE